MPITLTFNWSRRYAAFLNSKRGLSALTILIVLSLLAILAPLFASQNPYDLSQVTIENSLLPPGSITSHSFRAPFGTDGMGRDLWSAILYGLRISLFVGVGAGFVALVIGSCLGLIAAQASERISSIIMGLVDLQLTLPPILIALVFLALSGPGIENIAIALICSQWAYYTRVMRSLAIVEYNKEYVLAAYSLGLSNLGILVKHILPNTIAPLLVFCAAQTSHAISLEATLSFLGVGVPQTEPSLGILVANGFEFIISGRYWIVLFPSFILLTIVVSLNVLAAVIREILSEKSS